MRERALVIKPKKTWSLDDFKEIWRYRELLFFFVWRDIKVRYKQTAIGILWAVIQPFITMVVFSVFFGTLAKIPSEGIPYPIFVYTGILFWQFFSSSLGDSANTLITNASLVTKVYFPRLIIPIADTATKLVDLFFASIVLLFIMIYYHYTPHLMGILLAPLLLLISFLGAVGAGLILSAINVKYRDVRYALPFFIQILLFVTPVIYPPSIAGKYSWILAINPMTGVLKAARGSLLGTEPVNWALLGLSFVAVSILFFVGVALFKRTERYFADIV
ncbi:ABC transporter permease [Patescibacteria group bacterium]|nr:ABC transporter permease [Patescibacteria group bacterium]